MCCFIVDPFVYLLVCMFAHLLVYFSIVSFGFSFYLLMFVASSYSAW